MAPVETDKTLLGSLPSSLRTPIAAGAVIAGLVISVATQAQKIPPLYLVSAFAVVWASLATVFAIQRLFGSIGSRITPTTASGSVTNRKRLSRVSYAVTFLVVLGICWSAYMILAVRAFIVTNASHASCAGNVSNASVAGKRAVVHVRNLSDIPLRIEQLGGRYEGTANPRTAEQPLSYWERFGTGQGGFEIGTVLVASRNGTCVERLVVDDSFWNIW